MKKKKLIKRLLIVLGLLVGVVVGGGVAANLYLDSLLNKMDKSVIVNTENLNIFKSEIEDKKNNRVVTHIALLALDGDDDGSTRTDAIKIVSLDETYYKMCLTSIQRDTLVYQPLQDCYEKLNHAYWRNGIEGTLSAINYNFDLDCTKYMLFSFANVENIVDTLGGVDIELTSKEIAQNIRDIGIYGSPGVYHLNGWQVVQYCRIRTIDSDYKRMDRQNNVINAIIKQLKNKSISELLNVVNEILPYVQTNLTNSEIKGYLLDALKYNISSFPTYQFPNNLDNIIGNITVKGYGPNVVLNDFSNEIIQFHKNIYGDNGYTPSNNVLKTKEATLQMYYDY